MQLLISDANILIDIEKEELTSFMFSMDLKFAVPDILYQEELITHHSHLLEYGLKIKSISSVYIAKTIELVHKYSKASRNDLLALALALQENCPLLTGDKSLRKAAENESVVVRGTIWLVTEMIKAKIINQEIARSVYQKMKNNGSRLPWEEIEAILKVQDTS